MLLFCPAVLCAGLAPAGRALEGTAAKAACDLPRLLIVGLTLDSLQVRIGQAARFALSADQALATLRDVVDAIAQWRAVAMNPDVGMSVAELDDFEPAFEHRDFHEAMSLVV